MVGPSVCRRLVGIFVPIPGAPVGVAEPQIGEPLPRSQNQNQDQNLMNEVGLKWPTENVSSFGGGAVN